MTKQQQQLVEDNMNLVYFVLHDKFRRIAHDEDLVQTGMVALCYAGKSYEETRGSFSTYAYKSIYMAICNELDRRNKHRDVNIISLNYELDGKDGEAMKIEDVIAGEPDVDFVEFDELYNKLSDFDKRIVDLRKQGLNNTQIGAELGYSKQCISQRLRRLKRMYDQMYGEQV